MIWIFNLGREKAHVNARFKYTHNALLSEYNRIAETTSGGFLVHIVIRSQSRINAVPTGWPHYEEEKIYPARWKATQLHMLLVAAVVSKTSCKCNLILNNARSWHCLHWPRTRYVCSQVPLCAYWDLITMQKTTGTLNNTRGKCRFSDNVSRYRPH